MTDPVNPPRPDGEPTAASVQLRTELDRIYDEYLGRWGPGEEHQLFREIAEAFKPSLDSLMITPELVRRIRALHEEFGHGPDQPDDIPGFVQTLTEHPIVRDGVELRLAYTALAKLAGAEHRLDHILALIGPRNISGRVEEYLRRAVDLYLFGFQVEAIVMCGAAIEAAYPARFTDSEMSELGYAKDDDRFECREYEMAALRQGVFTSEQRQMARRLRRTRNDVVHETLLVGFSAADALSATAALLSSLFPA